MVGQPIVGDQRHVDAGLERQERGAVNPVLLLDGSHAEVVADDDALEAELPAEQSGDRRPREGRRITRIEAAVEDVPRHDAVGQLFGDELAVGQELDVGIGRLGHVDEAVVRVGVARSVAREVLESRQDARRAHAADPRARQRNDRPGVGAEAPAVADDHRVGRVVADVDDGRQVPVDPRAPQYVTDAKSLELGQREVVAGAQLLGGEGRGVAGGGTEPHDLPAFRVDGHEQSWRAAALSVLTRTGGEVGDLRGVDDVTAEEQETADADATDESLEIAVRVGAGAAKADEQKLAELPGESGGEGRIGRDGGTTTRPRGAHDNEQRRDERSVPPAGRRHHDHESPHCAPDPETRRHHFGSRGGPRRRASRTNVRRRGPRRRAFGTGLSWGATLVRW